MIKSPSPFLVAVGFIIIFSTLQFLLILRHKSPYVSDSLMYQHIYYEINGATYQQAREKILNDADLKNADEITRNIFENEKIYSQALGFFVKRPLYPAFASLIHFFTNNVYLSFIIPVFLAYIGVILLILFIFNFKFNKFYSTMGTLLFISFYPFLDWSTYFLTDTIGAFFWMLQLILIFKSLNSKDSKWQYYFSISLVVSLLNREQSILMLPMVFLIFLFIKLTKLKNVKLKNLISIIKSSSLILLLYFLISYLTNQKNLLDTIVYTMNSYGLNNQRFTLNEIAHYLISTAAFSHLVFTRELVTHHWWSTFSIFALIGAGQLLRSVKKIELIDIIIISSAIASYLSIFIYPVLSYRYFYPVVIAVIYFAIYFIYSISIKLNENKKYI